MNRIKIKMINKYKLETHDFMGYKFDKENSTFHHLIIDKKNCKSLGFKHGRYDWNGAILNKISHEYLHIIEHYDFEIFMKITNHMIAMNENGELDYFNLHEIYEWLKVFEITYRDTTNKNGDKIIKKEYTKRAIL